MITENDILVRLQAGEDAQKIADELSAALNAANKTYLAEKEEKAKKEAEAKAEVEAKKKELAELIANSVMKYIALVDPKLVEDEDEDLNAAEVQKLLDSIIPLMSSLKNIQGLMPASVVPFEKMPATKTDDEILKDFLMKNIG